MDWQDESVLVARSYFCSILWKTCYQRRFGRGARLFAAARVNLSDYVLQRKPGHVQQSYCVSDAPSYYNVNPQVRDLQGFVDVKKSSHFEVLAVVRIQSERITEIVGRYVASKYNMSKFAELMYSIMSPAQMQSIGSDQNNQART